MPPVSFRRSLPEDAGKYFDKESRVLEAPMTIRVADQVCVGHFWERGRPWGAEGTGETEGGCLWIGERPRVLSGAGRAVPRAPKHTLRSRCPGV